MNVGRANICNDLSIILLCEKMRWDYFTYLKQPLWFIEALEQKINLDIAYKNAEIKSQNRQTNRKR